MAVNFLADGERAVVVAPTGGLTAGAGYQIAQLFGVVLSTAASGINTTLAISGAHRIAKSTATGITFAVGDNVFWDTTNGVATTTTTLSRVGKALAAATPNTVAAVDVLIVQP
jgi:predicted RecA/RadA family phage recombinase